MQENLLEKYWDKVLPLLQNKYSRVPTDLWKTVRGQYDGVVRLIRETYGLGRADIIFEGEIRDLINRTCWEYEAEDEARGAA
jgi:hypothetical protein